MSTTCSAACVEQRSSRSRPPRLRARLRFLLRVRRRFRVRLRFRVRFFVPVRLLVRVRLRFSVGFLVRVLGLLLQHDRRGRRRGIRRSARFACFDLRQRRRRGRARGLLRVRALRSHGLFLGAVGAAVADERRVGGGLHGGRRRDVARPRLFCALQHDRDPRDEAENDGRSHGIEHVGFGHAPPA